MHSNKLWDFFPQSVVSIILKLKTIETYLGCCTDNLRQITSTEKFITRITWKILIHFQGESEKLNFNY